LVFHEVVDFACSFTSGFEEHCAHRRIDQIMNSPGNSCWPMAFTCILAAAVWQYAGRGLAAWLWSLGVEIRGLSTSDCRSYSTREGNSRRARIVRRMSTAAFVVIAILTLAAGGRAGHAAKIECTRR